MQFTPSATQRIKEILSEEGNDALRLRIFVQGGGCSGFQYGFTLDETVAEDDITFEVDGVSILVDVMSMQYLQGAEVTYEEDLTGSQFRISNPNAKSTCGCGASFTV